MCFIEYFSTVRRQKHVSRLVQANHDLDVTGEVELAYEKEV